MDSPIILTGPAADWDMHRQAMDQVVDDDGEINWFAAFSADPGCTKCPGCGEFYFEEGWHIAASPRPTG